jgi:hypothetical protein
MPLVKYVRNADPNSGTAVITGLEDRPDIPIGGEGELTQDEFHTLTSAGLILEVVGDDLEDLGRSELDDRLTAAGLDPKDYKNKQEAVDALRDVGSAGTPSSEELPPSATTGPGGVAGGGAPAGPGGAAGGTAAGGGPATPTGGTTTGGGA